VKCLADKKDGRRASKRPDQVDHPAFDRHEPRSIENLQALRLSDPEGCFVIADGDELVGYSYSKVLGIEGYLGPLGLLPEYREAGYGKFLISESLQYLKSHCKVIGLEVLPEYGQNIGLYHRMGFVSGFPSLLFEFPEVTESSGGRDLSEVTESSGNFQISTFPELLKMEQDIVINKIDAWTRKYFNGLSFKKDLEITRSLNGRIMVSFKGSEPVGFLAYSKTFLPYLWGAVKVHEAQNDIMMDILTYFARLNAVKSVVVQVNSHNADLVDLLIKMDFKVYRSINRMVLKGYEGNYLEKSRGMLMRGWRG
jgi:GNAT superfamily N-acetyltransferase